MSVTLMNKIGASAPIIDVQNDKTYQKKGIDFLWPTTTRHITVDSKADSYFRTWNYFLETVSFSEHADFDSSGVTDKLGCFITSEADYFFYCFPEMKIKGEEPIPVNEVHVFPMPAAQKWIAENIHKFAHLKKVTSTQKNGKTYFTKGYNIPRRIVQEAIPIKIFTGIPF